MDCSTKATVGAALLEETDATAPRVGILPTENREVVDSREARDPGRRGDCKPVANCRGMGSGRGVGDGGGGGDVVDKTAGGSTAGETSSSIGIVGGEPYVTPSPIVETFFSWVGDAWAKRREREDGRAPGEELERVRV